VVIALLMVASVTALFGQSWVDSDQNEPNGTRYQTFLSPTLGVPVSFLIYLPPDYQTPPLQRFPVVYWLHGLGGAQRAGARSFLPELDAAIRVGKAPSMIVVFVNGLGDSRFVDSFDGKRPVATVIAKDLVGHIDKTFRTIARRDARALEGFSMGGFGAAHLAFKFPEVFGAVSIMAGALLDGEGVATANPELYEKNFGGNREYFEACDPWRLVERNVQLIREHTLIRIGIGDQDPLLERNRKFHELLESLKIDHEYFVVPGVGQQPVLFYQKLGPEGFAFYTRVFVSRLRR
jgi:endo-1,4-beta-xylanase